jgi:hypothetical protein
MTSVARRVTNQTPEAGAAAVAAPPAHTVVAASGGSKTTSREPPGQWAVITGAGHTAENGKPAVSRKPGAARAAKLPPVRMSIRIPELAKWIAAHTSFTFAEAAAASAPSPCSPTVMAYTLPDPRLAPALAELGYLMTAGGKNGYTVTAIRAAAEPEATRPAKTRPGSSAPTS